MRYHLSLSPDALRNEPMLPYILRDAGITDVWLTGFLYGYRYYPLQQTQQLAQQLRDVGLMPHLINVPLGHPGDSLGAHDGDLPLTPPPHWQLATDVNGNTFAGTSLHAPATEENAQFLRDAASVGVDKIFLDDDFRLARSPGIIGGCFCPAHREQFLRQHGYPESTWDELLEAVRTRTLCPVLEAWVNFCCDELTASFRAQQAAAPAIELGPMVMFLGAEKAGIRLTDYAQVPVRVGEGMFDDESFSQVKCKTDELFSALFHRRFVQPDLAYSETTAFPADRLSARNMAAKLAIPLISDVRNVMFMSGLTAFPVTHWDTLAPAMRTQNRIHVTIAGHTPRGPFKHYWGKGSRYVGDDRPYSLFLALGIPFEVTDNIRDGWVFMADADVRDARTASAGAQLVSRPDVAIGTMHTFPETLTALFALKHELLPTLHDVPVVLEDIPAVCAWYPTAHAALIWNLTEQRETLTVRYHGSQHPITLNGLEFSLLENL